MNEKQTPSARKAKFWLATFLWAAMFFTVLPTTAQVNYAVSGSTAYVTYSPDASGNVVIDSTYNGYPVTSIGYQAFYYNANLTGVTIPNSITNIGELAFNGCASLISVAIPNSVTGIGSSAFSSCSGLGDVTIGNSVISIEAGAFSACTSLTNISVGTANPTYSSIDGVLFNKAQTTLIQFPGGRSGSYLIPNSVTNIDGAFYYCLNLTSVTVGNGITSIGTHAFSQCTSLSNVTIPNNVTSIGTYAFYYCTSLSNVTIPNSVTSIGTYAFYSCTSLTSVTIPSSVNSIMEGTFRGCTSLTNVMIPNSVSSIGWQAFIECTSLTNITIPSSVSSVGDAAFSGCTSLRSVTISASSIGPDAFSQCTSLTNVMMSSSVTIIGSGAFSGCTSLASVTIPNSVTNIGSSVFGGCTNLTSILVTAANPTYSSIDGVLFNKAETTLIQFPGGRGGDYVIPNSVTNIEWTAFGGFGGNNRLRSVTIPDSVTSIAAYLFYGCTSLTDVIIPNTVTSIGSWAFSDCGSLSNVMIPNSVTSIGEYAFFYCTNLTSVRIPSGVTSIMEATFRGCTSLTTVTIPNSVIGIGYYAFLDCSSLTSVTIPNGTTNIASYGFGGCPSLTNFSVGAANPTYSSIDGVLFDKAQTTLIQFPTGRGGSYLIPNIVTNIYGSAFSQCPRLTSISIPAGVTDIGAQLFFGCTGLMNLFVDAANPNYSSVNGVLFDKAQTTLVRFPGGRGGSYVIPVGVGSIGFEAFSYCTGLTSVMFPGSVTDIDDYAFDYCINLTNLTFLGNAPLLWHYFENVGAGATVYYYYGTIGWEQTYGGLPTVMLSAPAPQITNGSTGVKPGGFGFTLNGVVNQIIVIEASTDLTNWQPIWTNTLSGAFTNFVDPQWLTHPHRFYRLQSN